MFTLFFYKNTRLNILRWEYIEEKAIVLKQKKNKKHRGSSWVL